jgi:hypothetical protein
MSLGGWWSSEFGAVLFFPPNRGFDFYFEFLPAKIEGSRQIEGSISILNFFPPNRGFDFYSCIDDRWPMA